MKTVNSSISYVTDNSVIETFKLMILLGKKDTMTDDAFADYWLSHHAPLAKKMPGLRKYVVNVVKRPPNREPEYNGVVELWFDNKETMKAAFASPEGQATQRDTEKFTSKLTTMYIEEHSIMQTGDRSQLLSGRRSPQLARTSDEMSLRNVDL